MERVRNCWKWLNDRNMIGMRALTMYVTLWLTWASFKWAAMFASVSKFDGTGTAAVIAAVLIPVTALQKFVFDNYTASKEMK